VTLCITYISKATTANERTTFIAINALVSTIGFIVGPGDQPFKLLDVKLLSLLSGWV
jgi:hypothetical protein